jgi:hypothetical protein
MPWAISLRRCAASPTSYINPPAPSVTAHATAWSFHARSWGHLRIEKDPGTLLEALKMLPGSVPIRVRHVGAPLDAALGKAARDFAARDPRYRFLGPLPHGLARIAIASSDILVHPSIMEGGANVIVEAVTSGTPAIAAAFRATSACWDATTPDSSRRAMPPASPRSSRAPAATRPSSARCALRAPGRKPLFRPEAETRAIRAVVARLLA